MYADDLVIISESANGLQNAIDNLHDYCLKRKLSVNHNKTKVMTFNKRGHFLSNNNFSYGNSPIQLCDNYTYLGILFTPSGSFFLKEKACKAFFKIRENLYNSSGKCSFKLFHTLIKPILCYGCEIWAPYLLKGLKDGNFIDICDKLIAENLHIKVCKLILGVHRKATNNAVRAELGSYPLLIFMLSLSLKYWWKLTNDCVSGSTSLAVQSLIDNRLLQNSNFFSWSNGIKNICNLMGNVEIWHKPNILHKSSIISVVSSCMQSVYNDEWYYRISNVQLKLRTYCSFKSSFECENYIHILSRTKRSNFCKLRVSAHNLAIETGRHTTPRVPQENMICTKCDLNETEDEYHFIMNCKAYDNLRYNLLSQIKSILVTTNFSDNDFFIAIMSAKDNDMLQIVCAYINAAFRIRSNAS
jgi:hypothetical protein